MALVDLEVSLSEEERRIKETAHRFGAEGLAISLGVSSDAPGEAAPRRAASGGG